jgi:hypothetical protein
MEVTKSLNRHPVLVAAAVIVVVALVVVMRFPRGGGSRAAQTISGVPQGWYTTDDGQTWFRADINKLTPFDHNGKPAYRCHVWTCDGGKTKFVSHLERYKPAVLKYYAAKGTVEVWEVPPGGVEIKSALTGNTGWVDASLPGAQGVRTPRCPGGSGEPVPVDAQQPDAAG